MRTLLRNLSSAFIALAVASPLVLTSCAARVETGYRVHDSYYNDDHVWDNNEVVFYSRWEAETHRDHRDFRKRSADEQKEYYTWRHNQH
jgi:hypothetical protein